VHFFVLPASTKVNPVVTILFKIFSDRLARNFRTPCYLQDSTFRYTAFALNNGGDESAIFMRGKNRERFGSNNLKQHFEIREEKFLDVKIRL
jgi:hypothetical protein